MKLFSDFETSLEFFTNEAVRALYDHEPGFSEEIVTEHERSDRESSAGQAYPVVENSPKRVV